MSGIEFMEPPKPRTNRAEDHGPIAKALRDRPNQWAKVFSGVGAHFAPQIKQARVKAYRPPGSFEAVARKNGDGYDIYARYVGDAS